MNLASDVVNRVGRGGYLLLGGEAHAGAGEEMWKLLEVLGGVAELARECCEERGADLVLYPPLSRMHGQDAAPVQHALAVVEVLRVALAAQLMVLDPSAEQR